MTSQSELERWTNGLHPEGYPHRPCVPLRSPDEHHKLCHFRETVTEHSHGVY